MDLIDNNSGLKNTILEVADIAAYLWQRGWAERNAGNISVNVSHLIREETITTKDPSYIDLPFAYPELGSMYFFVSGTGKRMRDMAREPLNNAMIILLNERGDRYSIISREAEQAAFRPTSELPTHLSIHQMIHLRGSSERVVIHTHANELVALTQIREYCNEEKLNKL